MSYRRIDTQDGVTVMNKDLYDNLQDGIEERGVTPQMFGAIGDGTHDDTESIQAMFDSNKGIYHIPSGIYIISSPIFIKNNSVIYGESSETSIFKRKKNNWVDNPPVFSEENSHMFIIGISDEDSPVDYVEFYRCGIDGDRFNSILPEDASEGNFSNSLHNIYVKNLKKFVLEDCQLKNSIGTGITITGVEQNFIHNSIFSNCGAPITGVMARNAITLSNTFWDTTHDKEVIIRGSTHIIGNYFYGCNDEAIAGSDIDKLIVTNNTFKNIGQYCFEYMKSTENFQGLFIFDSNIFDGVAQQLFNFSTSNEKVFVTISNNIFKGLGSIDRPTGPKLTSLTAIYLPDEGNNIYLKVQGNTFEFDSDNYAFIIQSANGVTFIDNKVNIKTSGENTALFSLKGKCVVGNNIINIEQTSGSINSSNSRPIAITGDTELLLYGNDITFKGTSYVDFFSVGQQGQNIELRNNKFYLEDFTRFVTFFSGITCKSFRVISNFFKVKNYCFTYQEISGEDALEIINGEFINNYYVVPDNFQQYFEFIRPTLKDKITHLNENNNVQFY